MNLLVSPLRILLITVFLFCSQARADWEAEVYSLEGTAKKKTVQNSSLEDVVINTKLSDGDEIQVGGHSRVALQFKSGYFVRLNSDARLRISSDLALDNGKMHFFNRITGNSPVIHTPVVSAAIRGTEGIVSVTKSESIVDILEGKAAVYNKYGEVTLTANERATTKKASAPVKTVIISGFDSVQWTISLPPGAEETVKFLAAGKMKEAKELVEKKDTLQASTALSQSYILQAEKNILEARSVVENALIKSPQERILLGRSAELSLYFGDIRQAQEYIYRACGNSCVDPHLQTVQGFIELVTASPEKALVSFTESIKKSSELSTPYLGAALAYVQLDQNEQAKEYLMKAIHLDPTISVYRSYLAKLFFEDEKEDAAVNELSEGMRLDPLDPTPHLYKAYVNLAQNNPLEALSDIEDSISKNNNRAVYRSSLLLDQDTAVRSAALGRVFLEAGFEEAARIEAIRSTVKDPSNFSAHRLLWETQDPIFYADGALSELRLAKLLAPLNSNLSSAGATSSSLNSYDSFFEKNYTRSGIGYTYDGRDDTHIPSVESVGRQGDYAWGMGATSAAGGGSKHNSFARDSLVSGAVERQFAWNKKLRVEAQGREISSKDSNLDNETIDTTLGGGSVSYIYKRDSDQTVIFDLGIDRTIARSHTPLLNRDIFFNSVIDTIETIDLNELLIDQILHEQVNLYRVGTQYLFDGEDISIIFGSQLLHQEPKRREESIILEDSLGFLTGLETSIAGESHSEITGHDGYLYSTLHLLKDFDLTLGVVRTDIESDLTEIPPFLDQTKSNGRFNPKIGGTYELTDHLYLRSSYSESLRKSSLEDQISLEPTYIGGINQRFNDLTGTISKDSGIGIDWKDPGDIYIGAEYIYRRLTEDLSVLDEAITANFNTGEASYSLTPTDDSLTHRSQHLARTYILKKIDNNYALSLEHRHSEEDATDTGNDEGIADDTISGTLRWFSSTGLFAFGKASWLRQDRALRDPFPDGIETVWIFIAGAGYRFPHRHGKFQVEVQNIGANDFVLDQSTGFSTNIKDDTAVIAKVEFNF